MTSALERLAVANRQANIEEREIALGTIDGELDFSPLSSFLIGGQTQQGKTVLMAYLCCMAVIAGGSIVLIDPHCNERRRGLTQKIEPLSDWFIGEPLDFQDMDEVLARFEWLGQEYIQRKKPNGLAGKQPIFLVVDEYNELFASLKKDQKELVALTIGNMARGGSKFGMFAFLCGHNWRLDRTGGSDVRNNIVGRISVKCESSDMSMVLDREKDEFEPLCQPPLRPGEAIAYRPGAGLARTRIPLTEREDCEAVARMIRRIGGRSDVKRPEIRASAGADKSKREKEDGKPDEGGKALAQGAPNRPNVSPNNPNVAPSERTLIIALGNKHLMETGKVVRRKLHDAMKAKIKGWDADDYWKVQAICNELGWHRSMTTSMTATEWEVLKRRYNYTCLGCGRQEPAVKLEPDHVVPRSRGGSDGVSNRQPLCKDCNKRKGARTIDYRKQGAHV